MVLLSHHQRSSFQCKMKTSTEIRNWTAAESGGPWNTQSIMGWLHQIPHLKIQGTKTNVQPILKILIPYPKSI